MKTATELRDLYAKKKITPHEAVHDSLKAIHKNNAIINAFLEIVDPTDQVSSLPVFDQKKYPLWGIPISIKDNYCTKGIVTTASSNVLKDYIPPYDATVVAKLKKAGAIIMGKTNMDAWAHGSSTETSDFGPTKNPHNITRMPGGSSGGAAASVATGMVPVAIGSETAGSVRQPAAWCGVVGLKPTYGRISRYGLIAMASSTDCPGILSNSIEDATLFLSVLSDKDPYDATTLDDTLSLDEYTAPPKKYRIGYSETYLEGVDEDTKKAFKSIVNNLTSLGHTVVPISLMSPHYSIAVYTVVQRAEVSSNLARFDGIRYGHGRDKFGFEAKKRIMLGTHVLSVGYFDAYYLKAQKVRTEIILDFKHAFTTVDALIAPVSPSPALPLGDSKKYPHFGEIMDVLVEPSSIAGLPGISIPVGFSSEKLPIGMQIMTPWKQEARMLALAKQLEPIYKFSTAFAPSL